MKSFQLFIKYLMGGEPGEILNGIANAMYTDLIFNQAKFTSMAHQVYFIRHLELISLEIGTVIFGLEIEGRNSNKDIVLSMRVWLEN